MANVCSNNPVSKVANPNNYMRKYLCYTMYKTVNLSSARIIKHNQISHNRHSRRVAWWPGKEGMYLKCVCLWMSGVWNFKSPNSRSVLDVLRDSSASKVSQLIQRDSRSEPAPKKMINLQHVLVWCRCKTLYNVLQQDQTVSVIIQVYVNPNHIRHYSS